MSASIFEQARSKLKAVAVAEKKAAPVICDSSAKYDALMAETYLEAYAASIEAHTFQSISLPLTRECARALCDDAVDIDADAHLVQLAQAIDTAFRQLRGGSCKQFFVRLSSRSPKDAPLFMPSFRPLLESCRARMFRELGDSRFTRLHALQVAATLAMANKTGRDAVLLLSKSQRIRDDLTRFSQGELGDDFRVWVREFRFLPLEFELRAFVYARQLTAITQYNNYCFFPHLVAHKEALRAKVEAFVASVLPSLPLEHCVLDLAFVRDNDVESDLFLDSSVDVTAFRVVIVEVNPLAEFAGSGLFSWVIDMELLMGRTAEPKPVFRIVAREADAEQTTELASEWAQFV